MVGCLIGADPLILGFGGDSLVQIPAAEAHRIVVITDGGPQDDDDQDEDDEDLEGKEST